MAVLTTSNLLSEQRWDISDARRIESGVRNDFDELITGLVTNTQQGYIVRGFSIAVGGSIGSPANGLQMVVDPGAVLNINASVSGTIFQTPLGTANQTLNAATNTNVTGSFTASSTNYVGIDYNRFADPSTNVTKYIWNAAANDEIPTIAPAAQTLTYKIFITTSTWAVNVLPVAIVTTDSNGNVTSITDARWMLCSLETGGVAPNPNYTYPWSEGQVQSPVTTTSNSVDPFSGGDKQLTCLKDWMNAVMSQIEGIQGTPNWFSSLGPTSIQTILQDLGNTVITGAGEISNGILPNSTAILVTTGTVANGSTQVTGLSSVAGLYNGAFVFGTGITEGTTIIGVGQYTFTVTSANATAGAAYSNNGQTFTVTSTISAGTTLVCTGTGAPTASGTLTKVSGTGDATITFSSFSSSSTDVTLSKPATLNGSGIGLTFYSPAVITAPGQINWDEPIYIRVIGSALTYTLAANPSSTDITLADDEVAYIVFNRNVTITPNLIFISGSPIVNSVGAVSWTGGLLVGDYIKVESDSVSGYYQILTINSASQVTLTTNVASEDSYPAGISAEYAFGSYYASPTPSTDRNIFISSRETVPADAFWLFLREDNGGSPRVYIRFLAQELDNGESVEVSGTTSLQLLQYIGSLSAGDSSPQYVSALNPGSLPQITDLSIGAGSTITSGQYFLLNSSANAREYAVWFKVDGSGTAPVVPNTNGLIEVDILSSDTSAQVATKLENALISSPFGDFYATSGEQYVFTITPANATAGATYTNNGQTFTVVSSISSGGGSSLLASASNFALLAYSTITNTGASVITGDVGLTPGSAVTPGGWTLIGTEYIDDSTATTAQSDANSAYVSLAAHVGYVAIPSTLDGQTLTAGYYSESSGTFNLASSGPATLTLSGSPTDVFVFKAASTLTTGAGGIPTITLTGGALASNVYWLVGSSATINSGSAGTFQGNIIAQASITDTLGGTVNGSMVALNGAITISAAANANAIPGSSGTTLIASGTGNPTSSGTLTKASGAGDATIAFSAYTEITNVLVTNTSAGATNATSNGNVGAPFATYTVQSGTGVGNYFIHDGDSLTLAIKELDLALGELEASLDNPTYDEVVEIVASGATPPTSLNGPVANSTIITLPLNSRESDTLAQYTVGKGTLMVFLNGQFLDIESGAYVEVGVAGAPSNKIQILTLPGGGLVVGDELEFRIGSGGGGGGGGGVGPAGPAGPSGPAGTNGLGNMGAISTKVGPTTYDVLTGDQFLLADCTGGAVTFDLPAASSVPGRVFYFKKTDATSNYMFVVAAGSDLIDGFGMQSSNVQYYEFAIVSSGSAWWVF